MSYIFIFVGLCCEVLSFCFICHVSLYFPLLLAALGLATGCVQPECQTHWIVHASHKCCSKLLIILPAARKKPTPKHLSATPWLLSINPETRRDLFLQQVVALHVCEEPFRSCTQIRLHLAIHTCQTCVCSKKACAPQTFYTYYTKHLRTKHLWHFYARQLVHQTTLPQTPCAADPLQQKIFTSNIFHTREPVHHTNFTQGNLYIKTSLKTGTFYAQHLLHQTRWWWWWWWCLVVLLLLLVVVVSCKHVKK